MNSPVRGVVAALAFVVAAAPALAATCEASFDETVQPIFTKRCVACHNDRSPGSGVSLQKGSAFAQLVGVPSTELPDVARVTPGDTAASYLFHKVMGTQKDVGGSGVRMPLGGKLNAAELEAIETWIAGCTVEPVAQ